MLTCQLDKQWLSIINPTPTTATQSQNKMICLPANRMWNQVRLSRRCIIFLHNSSYVKVGLPPLPLPPPSDLYCSFLPPLYLCHNLCPPLDIFPRVVFPGPPRRLLFPSLSYNRLGPSQSASFNLGVHIVSFGILLISSYLVLFLSVMLSLVSWYVSSFLPNSLDTIQGFVQCFICFAIFCHLVSHCFEAFQNPLI